MDMEPTEGKRMHDLAKRLFPICRSITGDGVRETLNIIKESIPLSVHEVPSGTPAFDWTVPKEWNIKDAWVIDPRGKKIIEFKKNNLHVVGYSTPVDREMPLSELQEHLYSIPEQPDAIPYVTSYYQERWGFCLAHRERQSLEEGTYGVHIESELKDGSLSYGELIIPGATEKEIFLSTYVCHPSMANNELSGPVVATFLAQWIARAPRRYTYRIIFIPETIGSLTYLSKNIRAMKENVVAGFNLTCVGDDRAFSYLPSRSGATRADKVALRVLRARHPGFVSYTYLERGSDERQYCSPGVDLPVASLMRTKYGAYPEYHTSLDDLELVTPEGLQGSYDVLKECLETLEANPAYRAANFGEPQLGKRGLYPTLSRKGSTGYSVQMLLDVLAYADGTNDAAAFAEMFHASAAEVRSAIEALLAAKLIVEE